MLISVIIPVYRAEAYVERCLRSIEAQRYDDFEVIIINDCSPDGSMAVVENTLTDCPRLKARSVVLHNDRNIGSALTRRRGMRQARGEYVVQVDSDDYVSADFLSQLAAVATADDADIVICDFFFDIDGRLSRRHYPVTPSAERSECFRQAMAGITHNGLWNKLVRRSLYVDNNIYPVEGINMFDDKSVTFRLIYFAKRISLLNKPLYYYNRSNESAITKTARAARFEQTYALLDLIDKFGEEHPYDTTMRKGIQEYKLLVTSAMLYYATNEQISRLPSLERDVPWSVLLATPAAKIHHKTIVALAKLHLRPAVRLIRRFAANKQ